MSASSSSDSDSSDKSDYKRKICNKKKKYWKLKKHNPTKICTKLRAKLLTTAYKSKALKFKLEEDLLYHQIFFLTFIESLEIIFSKYKETCEVLLDYQKIRGEDIKYYLKTSIRVFYMQILMSIVEG